MTFIENALFKNSGVICWPLLFSSLPDELSIDKNNNFLSTQLMIVPTA